MNCWVLFGDAVPRDVCLVSVEPTERLNVNVMLLNRVGFVDFMWKSRLAVTDGGGGVISVMLVMVNP
jgi:hypothetical protein